MHVSSSYASDILGSFETDLELLNNWDAFRDLVPLHNLKKREKHPWRIVLLV